jgi:hypothetical protein
VNAAWSRLNRKSSSSEPREWGRTGWHDVRNTHHSASTPEYRRLGSQLKIRHSHLPGCFGEGLEQEAREAKKGVWADPHPLPPWEWRKLRRSRLPY